MWPVPSCHYTGTRLRDPECSCLSDCRRSAKSAALSAMRYTTPNAQHNVRGLTQELTLGFQYVGCVDTQRARSKRVRTLRPALRGLFPQPDLSCCRSSWCTRIIPPGRGGIKVARHLVSRSGISAPSALLQGFHFDCLVLQVPSRRSRIQGRRGEDTACKRAGRGLDCCAPT